LLRLAAKKTHIVFLVEEPPKEAKQHEEYICDVVIRLTYARERDYVRRVLQLDKVRAQKHARGFHDFTIRDGIGSTTGEFKTLLGAPTITDASLPATEASNRGNASRNNVLQEASLNINPDDPRVPKEAKKHQEQAYFYVMPSLHYHSRRVMEEELLPGEVIGAPTLTTACAGFGLKYLDELLAKRDESKLEPALGDDWGCAAGQPTALIGEDGTLKGWLAGRFLSQCFKNSEEPGAAVLLTTKLLDADSLFSRFVEHVDDPAGVEKNRQLIICRRLEVHDISSARLLHIVIELIEEARRRLLDKEILIPGYNPRNEGWRIRFVIDNWTAIRETYPHLAEDPLLLPALLFHLRRERVCSLIIANEDVGFRTAGVSPLSREMRDLTNRHIYTWRVPFFGQSRVALSVEPPSLEERKAAIRELSVRRAEQVTDGQNRIRTTIRVDPNFEYYKALDRDNPEMVPLKIYLRASRRYRRQPARYENEVNQLLTLLMTGGRADAPIRQELSRLLALLFHQKVTPQEREDILNRLTRFEADEPKRGVVVLEQFASYELLREYSHLQGGRQLDYTLVIEVDEFWAKSGPIHLFDMRPYLYAKTVEAGSPNRIEDPFRLFQPTKYDEQLKLKEKLELRHQFFHTTGYTHSERDDHPERTPKNPSLRFLAPSARNAVLPIS
jgi:KaiC/GvpD/RAD55 family RecA-like ATPase